MSIGKHDSAMRLHTLVGGGHLPLAYPLSSNRDSSIICLDFVRSAFWLDLKRPHPSLHDWVMIRDV